MSNGHNSGPYDKTLPTRDPYEVGPYDHVSEQQTIVVPAVNRAIPIHWEGVTGDTEHPYAVPADALEQAGGGIGYSLAYTDTSVMPALGDSTLVTTAVPSIKNNSDIVDEVTHGEDDPANWETQELPNAGNTHPAAKP